MKDVLPFDEYIELSMEDKAKYIMVCKPNRKDLVVDYFKLKDNHPLRLKSLSMDYGLFTQIKNNCSHNNDIVCDTLINPNSEADFFHNSITMKKINSSKAVELFIRLIKQGYKISFKDGKGSTDLIKTFSPPIYDRLYKLTTQEHKEKTI
jgi:hypothetical protein